MTQEQQTPQWICRECGGSTDIIWRHVCAGEPTPPATPQPETPLADVPHEEVDELVATIYAERRALSPPPDVERLTADDVEWVVNDSAELGVKIGNQFFFCYKGHSLIYDDGTHDDGRPMMWRPIFKREFGECVHPINYRDFTKIGTVSLNDSDEWKPLSSTSGEPT